MCLFTTLEAHLTTATNDSLIQKQYDVLRANINNILESLMLSETSKGCAEDDFLKESLSIELRDVKQRCHGLEKELDSNNQRLELSKQEYDNLERELKLMKDERDSLRKMVSECVERLEMEKELKETALKELNNEIQRRRDLGEGIKRFSAAFTARHKSFMSFNSEIMSKTEELRTNNNWVVVPVPKSLGG